MGEGGGEQEKKGGGAAAADARPAPISERRRVEGLWRGERERGEN